MTVQVRGVTSAESGTQTLPAGVVAGDLLIVMLRSFYQDEASSAPFGSVAGWTVLDNTRFAFWGIYAAVKPATASEPASYTWTATGGEQYLGAMVAAYSDTSSGLVAARTGTSSGPFRDRFETQFVSARPAGSLTVHLLGGSGTAITGYSGFTGTRTHHATLDLHSELVFADEPVPSGPPYYLERWRDLIVSIDTEAGTLGSGTRIAQGNFNWGIYPPEAPGDPNDGCYWSNTLVAVTETAPPPAAGGWQGWIID